MPGDDLSRFRALVLPDCVKLSDEEAARIRAFIAAGGSVLFSGESAVKDGEFQLDAGAVYEGPAAYRQDYCCPGETLKLPFGNAPFLCYDAAHRATVTDGEVLAQVYEPWFDRTYAAYCSHRNTPYRPEAAAHPAAVRKGNVIWLAHPFGGMYRREGAQLFREMLIVALKTVYQPLYTIRLPSAGRTRLTWQVHENRYVFHAAYASPIQRGTTAVIDDIVPLYHVPIEVSINEKVRSVKLVPTGETLDFEQQEGELRFEIPCVRCYQAVEILVD